VQDFLSLMGYWIEIFIVIVLQEQFIFMRGKVFDWSAWEDRKRLPIGIAALIAFLLGWMGAILGMCQVWYVGPIAKHFGDSGADVGLWIGCAFTMATYPPMRWLELRIVGR